MISKITVTVDGMGDFLFRQRGVREQLRIEAEAERILGGPTDDAGLQALALQVAALSILTEQAPAVWNLDRLDPLDPADMAKLAAVYDAFRTAECRRREAAA